MSSSSTTVTATVSDAKPKKASATKRKSPSQDDPAKPSPKGAGSDQPAKKVSRSAFFNVMAPMEYLNLPSVWKKRDKDHQNLKKNKAKLESASTDEERESASKRVLFHENNIGNFEARKHEVAENLRFLLDVAKSGCKVPAGALDKYFMALDAGLSARPEQQKEENDE
jgi:hypothetical protein